MSNLNNMEGAALNNQFHAMRNDRQQEVTQVIPDPAKLQDEIDQLEWKLSAAEKAVAKMKRKRDKAREAAAEWEAEYYKVLGQLLKYKLRDNAAEKENIMYRQLAVNEQTAREAAEARIARLIEAGDAMYRAARSVYIGYGHDKIYAAWHDEAHP